jgi:sialidase-1
VRRGGSDMTIRPYTGWSGQQNVRLAAFSADAGTTWSAPQAVPQLVDWGFADEGSVSSDPPSKRLYFVHPDSHARANLTLYASGDDGRSWRPQRTVYSGSAAYSDSKVLDPASAQGNGTTVGVLFERDGYGKVSFARVRADRADDLGARK